MRDARWRERRRSANLAEGANGEARARVAAFAGIGHTSLANAAEIVGASEQYGKLKDDMDRRD